jgi:hypothetical protein
MLVLFVKYRRRFGIALGQQEKVAPLDLLDTHRSKPFLRMGGNSERGTRENRVLRIQIARRNIVIHFDLKAHDSIFLAIIDPIRHLGFVRSHG